MLNVADHTERKLIIQPVETVSGTEHTPEDWFHYCLLRGRREVFSEVISLTPAIARHLLTVNEKNRPISDAKVSTYVADMASGRWDLNGESLKISRDGLLNDGQHRCASVVASGVTIQTVVTFGVDRGSRLTLDRQFPRTVAHAMVMDGAPPTYTKERAAAARILWSFRKGIPDALERDGATKTALYQEYRDYQKEIDGALDFIVENAKGNKILGGLGFTSAALAILRRTYLNADDFMSRYITGANLDAGDPILALRTKLINSPRLHAGSKLRLVLHAAKKWHDGAQVSFLRPPMRKRVK